MSQKSLFNFFKANSTATATGSSSTKRIADDSSIKDDSKKKRKLAPKQSAVSAAQTTLGFASTPKDKKTKKNKTPNQRVLESDDEEDRSSNDSDDSSIGDIKEVLRKENIDVEQRAEEADTGEFRKQLDQLQQQREQRREARLATLDSMNATATSNEASTRSTGDQTSAGNHTNQAFSSFANQNSSTPSKLSKKPALTPLEKQYVELKESHPGVLLAVECGYKYQFFDEDALIAHDVLKIGVYTKQHAHLPTASVPVQRIYFHVRRLVVAGYKVGIVKQTETAALKAAGANKSKTFERALDKVFTRSTFVGTDDIDPLHSTPDHKTGGYLWCIDERVQSTSSSCISIVALHTGTGDIVYDQFDDSLMRTELDTRLALLAPSEIVFGEGRLSTQTLAILSNAAGLHVEESGAYKGAAVGRSKHMQRGRVRLEALPATCFDDATARTRVERYMAADAAAAAATVVVAADDDDDEMTEEEPTTTTSATTTTSTSTSDGTAFQRLLSMDGVCLTCVAALHEFLSSLLHLNPLLCLIDNYRKFSDKIDMLVDGGAARNLEIFQSITPGANTRGTLFEHINRAQTAMGSRQLRRWLTSPLASSAAIRRRQAAVALLRPGTDRVTCLIPLKKALASLPDIERGLCRVYHRSATPTAFVTLMHALEKVLDALPSESDAKSQFGDVPNLVALLDCRGNIDDVNSNDSDVDGGGVNAIKAMIGGALNSLNSVNASNNTMLELFTVPCPQYPEVEKYTLELRAATNAMHQIHLPAMRSAMGLPDLQFVTVSQQEYMVEVKKSQKSRVPASWLLVSETTKVSRYRSPECAEALTALARARERLGVATAAAWQTFLTRFQTSYVALRGVVSALASLDALLALANLSVLEGYTRPTILDYASDAQGADALPLLQASNARHPVLEMLLTATGKQYVPNDFNVGEPTDDNDSLKRRCLLITGPNMGGKSSYVRTAAALVLLAQIGSYVPASSMSLRPFDALLARMGASDCLAAGRSTFAVEMHETSTILSHATSRSLLIIDELGRGTSTSDGTAIAEATLSHIAARIGAVCLFVTHFASLSELCNRLPKAIGAFHMGYLESESVDDVTDAPRITFLYKLRRGIAPASFGLNVARMAGIDSAILREAARQSKAVEQQAVLSEFIRLVSSQHQSNQQTTPNKSPR